MGRTRGDSRTRQPTGGRGVAESERRHDNTISGAAQFHGPTIQARDVHGGVHVHTAAPSPPPPPPRQLLAVSSSFINRAGDFAALDSALEQATESLSAQPLIVVTGPAGVGKTSLVSKWLRGLGARFPDGHLYADLRGHTPDGPALPTEALGRFLRGMGATAVPADPGEQAALWRSYAAGRKATVMLDNAFTAAQVRTLLPGDPSCLVVVTSRRALTGLVMDGGRFHHVRPLSGDDGIALLTRLIGNDRVSSQPSSAAQIVTLCAGLPLAVCLASARLAARPAQPLETLARVLADDATRLTALHVEGETTVSHALNASYAVLSEEAMVLYRRLGSLPLRVFDAHVAAAATGNSLSGAQACLDELGDANLLETGPATVRFHDLVRVHARMLAGTEDPASAGEETLRRVCDWHLHTATAAQARITPAQYTLPRTYTHPPVVPLPFDDDADALQWLDERRDDLMTLLECAADRGWNDTAWQLVDAMWPLFLRLRHYGLWIKAHEIGLGSARAAGNAEAERQMLNSGAIGLVAAGRPGEAAHWYTQSLQAARDAGDARDEGQAHHGLGTCHQLARDLPRARSHLLRAIGVWQRCGYARGAALSRIVLGDIALAEHDPQEAEVQLRQAHEELLQVDDRHDAARALVFLGSARAQAGHYNQGRELMESALASFTTSGATHWQARALEMLGDSAQAHGHHDDASGFHARAVELYKITSPLDASRLTLATAPPEDDPPPQ